MHALASGDLTSRISVRTTDETGQRLSALRDMSGSLVKIVSEVHDGSIAICPPEGCPARPGAKGLSGLTHRLGPRIDRDMAV